MSLGLVILGLFLFIMLIVVHELGHFIVAKRNGVDIEEFGIFFPPRLWSRKTKKGYIFSINIIPLGGFVRLKGEHDADTRPHTYGSSSLWVKTKILLAGVLMNVIAAFILLTLLSWVGMPQLVNNQFSVQSDAHASVYINSVEANSPASKVGLKAQEKVIALGPSGHLESANTISQFIALGKKYAGQTVDIKFLTPNDQVITKAITLRSASDIAQAAKQHKQEGYVGISISNSKSGLGLVRYTWSAPIVAVGTLGQFTGLTFHAVGTAVKGLGSTIAGLVTSNKTARQNGQTNATSQLAGPVGIFEILKNGSVLGYQFVLMVVALISLSLAIMNVLPIPALDGGKLFVTLIAHGLRKTLTEEVESLVYGLSFIVLLVLVVLITIVDVKRY